MKSKVPYWIHNILSVDTILSLCIIHFNIILSYEVQKNFSQCYTYYFG